MLSVCLFVRIGVGVCSSLFVVLLCLFVCCCCCCCCLLFVVLCCYIIDIILILFTSLQATQCFIFSVDKTDITRDVGRGSRASQVSVD